MNCISIKTEIMGTLAINNRPLDTQSMAAAENEIQCFPDFGLGDSRINYARMLTDASTTPTRTKKSKSRLAFLCYKHHLIQFMKADVPIITDRTKQQQRSKNIIPVGVYMITVALPRGSCSEYDYRRAKGCN